ncbi:hypothetical protein ACF1G4_35435 [Streptomyces caelestis]
MNTGEHLTTRGGEHVHDEQADHTPDSALTELRRRLEGGLARAGVKKTDLVARTRLGRTTVQLAFQTDGPVPSAQTVTALARALKLPVEKLLALQQVAAGGGSSDRPGPGRPIGQWDPHAPEVHPAGSAQDGTGSLGQRLLPGYVPRGHDRILAEAVQDAAAGHSRMLVLVGSSSTGKTRGCWEAVQPLAKQGWRLWHPFDPTRAEARVKTDRGDRLLVGALTRAGKDGRLAQDLAGGPALLERYQTGAPAARALLEAATDARRLGVGLHLPQAFLTDAAADYLHDTDWDQLTDDWAEKAYTELAEHVHGKHAPLSRITPRPQRRPPGPSPDSTPSPRPTGPVFRLADYLEQHGRTIRRHLCPTASFWHAAHTHLTRPDNLYNLTRAADTRFRLQWAHHLLHRAASHGSTNALARLAVLRKRAGD